MNDNDLEYIERDWGTIVDCPLPEWATHLSDGTYMEVGAQLCTRDGRRLGNAFISEISLHPHLGKVAHVITDAGNEFKMTIGELQTAFYAPKYVMNVSEAKARIYNISDSIIIILHKTKDVLERAIKDAQHTHDDHNSEMYMDLSLWDLVQEYESLMKEITTVLK